MSKIDTKQLDSDVSELARAHMQFSSCHNKLYSYLVMPENNEDLVIEIIGSWDDKSGEAKYVSELNQLIYAAATSMTAFIAVTKILGKRYKDDFLYGEYEAKNNAIINNNSFMFWRRLRNYVMHNSEAPISFKLYGQHQRKIKVYLSSHKLSNHDWRIGDKLDSPKDIQTIEYLARYKDGIYLANIIYNYEKAMQDLCGDIFIGIERLRRRTW